MRPQEEQVQEMVEIGRRAAERSSHYEDPELRQLVHHLLLTGYMTASTRRSPEPVAHQSYQEMVVDLSEGPRRAALELPDWCPVMEPQNCYSNALALAQEWEGLVYVEGYAHLGLIPLQHAWVEDEEGRIIDPTWSGMKRDETEALYVGVKFDPTLAWDLMLASGYSSVFESDWMQGNPVLRHGLKMHEGVAIATNAPTEASN